MQGKGALSVSVGKQVEVTGVMKIINNRSVLLARTVKADGRVYTMRHRHGSDVSPLAREHAAQKEETL